MTLDPLDELARLHQVVDLLAAKLTDRHAARLQCKKGCAACCVDALSVFDVEAERIRRAHPELLAAGTPHAPGACAFLDEEGSCRVYAVRPYVCRTQGLPLRWIELIEGQQAELRDICPLNVEGEPLEDLDPADCWTIGAVESRLAQLQQRVSGDARRTTLRELFAPQK
jgi:uncharacterized protein